MSNWKITLISPDGDEVVVHPENKATHGIYLTEDGVKGDIIDAPVKTQWESLAKQEGGTQKGVSWEYRDFSLQFHVTDNRISAEEADSLLRMLFDYEEDEWDPDTNRQTLLRFEVEKGPFAGTTRNLYLLMNDTPEHEIKRDPMMDQYFMPTIHVRAGQPMFFELDPKKNTPFVTSAFDFTGSGTFNGFVTVYNPTDRAMRHSWVVAAGAGAQASLPDFSWTGKKTKRVIGGPNPTRMIKLPTILPNSGGLRVTLERGKVMVEDKEGTNAMGRMPVPGQIFLYRIPPYTPKTQLPVKITNVPPGGGRIELRQPMLWSRPYGLERF